MTNQDLESNKESRLFVALSCLLILSVHGLVNIAGIHSLRIDHYWEMMNRELLRTKFIESVLYFHANPEGVSLIHYLFDRISWNNKYIVFDIVLPLLHCASFLLFFGFLQHQRVKYRKVVAVVLFFNPLVFLYFKFPWYSTFIFFTSCALLYILFSSKSNGWKLMWIAILLSSNCFMRASWQILIVVAFLVPLWFHVPRRYIAFSLLIVLIPASLYIKNYVFFHKFTTSTWLGMNLADHVPPGATNVTVSRIQSFRHIEYYREFIDENNPLVQKYKDYETLNGNDFNNIRYIQVSDRYLADVINNFSPLLSLKRAVSGLYRRFLNSPADFPYLYENGWPQHLPVWCYDIFDLPDVEVESPFGNPSKPELGLSLYAIMYPLATLVLLLNLRRLKKESLYLILLCWLISALYFAIEPGESHRMRFEIEPLWYFCVLTAMREFVVPHPAFQRIIGNFRRKPSPGRLSDVVE